MFGLDKLSSKKRNTFICLVDATFKILVTIGIQQVIKVQRQSNINELDYDEF